MAPWEKRWDFLGISLCFSDTCDVYTIYHKKNESSKRPENIFPAEVLGMECYKGSKKLGPFLVFVEFLESFSTSMPKRTTHLNSINYPRT